MSKIVYRGRNEGDFEIKCMLFYSIEMSNKVFIMRCMK